MHFVLRCEALAEERKIMEDVRTCWWVGALQEMAERKKLASKVK